MAESLDTLVARSTARWSRSAHERSRCSSRAPAALLLHDDLAWTYEEPDDDGRAIRGLIGFFNERSISRWPAKHRNAP